MESDRMIHLHRKLSLTIFLFQPLLNWPCDHRLEIAQKHCRMYFLAYRFYGSPTKIFQTQPPFDYSEEAFHTPSLLVKLLKTLCRIGRFIHQRGRQHFQLSICQTQTYQPNRDLLRQSRCLDYLGLCPTWPHLSLDAAASFIDPKELRHCLKSVSLTATHEVFSSLDLPGEPLVTGIAPIG